MKFYAKLYLLFFCLLLSACGPANADKMWRCHATNSRHAYWFQYAPTRIEAATLVKDRCEAGSFNSTCLIHCFPPKRRWHCVSVDAKGQTWYRNAVSRVTAIRGARRACKENSAAGHCRVPASYCSKT